MHKYKPKIVLSEPPGCVKLMSLLQLGFLLVSKIVKSEILIHGILKNPKLGVNFFYHLIFIYI